MNTEQQIIDAAEVTWISKSKSSGIKLLNIKEGGKGGKHSENSKKLISLAQKGKIFSEETKAKLRLKRAGRITPNKGKTRSKEAIEKSASFHRGKTVNIHTKNKIAKALTGRTLSQETRDKIAKGNTGRKGAVSGELRVKNIDTGETYKSLSAAALILGSTPSNICSMLKGRVRNRFNIQYHEEN